MKLARRIRWRSVNAENGVLGVVPVETVDAHLFPFLLPFPLDFLEVVFFRQRLHASQFSVALLGFRKIKIPVNNIIPFKVSGSWEVTRLRGQLNAVDPMNLNQIILAEGKKWRIKHTQK
jgi:hypothetical protein